MENKYKIIFFILLITVIYLYYQNKSIKETMVNIKETMVNTEDDIDEKIKKHINKIYLADVNSIRTLANISTELQKGTLKIPGNLTVEGELNVKKNSNIKGNLVVDKNSNVKGQTTINSLYGGKSTSGGWRDIIVNGGHLRFVVGSNKFGFHSNTNALHYYRGNSSQKLPIYKGVHAKGNIHVDDYLSTRRLDVRNDKGKGTTHFNYAHKGLNYIRGNLQSDNGGVKINGDLNTSNTITGKYIRGKRGQFGRHGYLVVGEHSGRGFVAARTYGCWYHSSDSSMRKLTSHKSQGNCGFRNYFDV